MRLTPIEARVTLVNEVFTMNPHIPRRNGHYEEEIAKALHGRKWEMYRPTAHSLKPEDFLDDERKSRFLTSCVDRALESLGNSDSSYRQRRVLMLRLGMENGQIEPFHCIAEQLGGVSHQRAEQIYAKAIGRLRHPDRAGYLSLFLSLGEIIPIY